jgi:uncharacterized DUF497 family protein
MRIDYDPAKRVHTIEGRGLDFEDAPEVFAGFHLTAPDLRRDYGEDRWISVGMLGERVVVLVWTDRAERRRIISMRKADKDERQTYFDRRDGSG